jgi:hypothetical protein
MNTKLTDFDKDYLIQVIIDIETAVGLKPFSYHKLNSYIESEIYEALYWRFIWANAKNIHTYDWLKPLIPKLPE